MGHMSDPDERTRAQRQQQGEDAVDEALDSALAHDRAREEAIEEGNLEELARRVNDRDS